MLVTNGGQVIRMPIHDVRIAGRQTQGVTLFRVAAGERVVSVASLGEGSEGEENGDAGPDGEEDGELGLDGGGPES
jgi:DNA gyrase subunit A